jgi:hypothetical protein
MHPVVPADRTPPGLAGLKSRERLYQPHHAAPCPNPEDAVLLHCYGEGVSSVALS